MGLVLRMGVQAGRRVLVLVMLLSVLAGAAGCNTVGGGKGAKANPQEPYPGWLIAAADQVAPVVGLVISSAAWRSGYLRAHEEAVARLRGHLRPLDVLLTSSKGRLSGNLGAGLFGHAAVYLGTEREIRAAGLWNDPAVLPHRARIRAGFDVIEATPQRDTWLTRLEWLANTDRVVALRPAERGPAWRVRSLRTFYGLIGTGFDHNFRAERHDQLYCTELVQQGMPELVLPTRTAYGRVVIMPDDLALATIAGRGCLRFVAYLRANRTHWEEVGASALRADIRAAAE